MSTSSINNLGGDLPPVLAAPLHTASDTTGNNPAGIDPPSGRFKPDISQLSPFGELHVLQRLLQLDQAKYHQITDQIALNLKTAAHAARSNGNTTAATQLSQLSTAFATASLGGQLPDMQNITSGGVRDSGSSSETGLAADQYSVVPPAVESQSDPQSPLVIILATLSNAGIDPSST